MPKPVHRVPTAAATPPHPHAGEHNLIACAERQFAASDFDAEHPVWVYLLRRDGVSPRSPEGIWFSLLYMVFYHEGSGRTLFRNSDPFTAPALAVTLPIGRNRRNLYGGRVTHHLESMRAEAAAAGPGWPCHNFRGDPAADWFTLKENLGRVWGNGRFGIYTTAEMLHKVNGVPVVVADFDNRNSSGPADGTARIYGRARKEMTITELDACAERAHEAVLAWGGTPAYTAVDRGVVESVLCNYGGMCRGKFYSGRNLDRQQDRVAEVERLGHALPELWEAREKVFPHEYLGEIAGWPGVDNRRLLAYRDHGRMLWPDEERPWFPGTSTAGTTTAG